METCSSFSSSGLGESKKSGLERDDCRQTRTTKEEEKQKCFHCTRIVLATIFQVTTLKIRMVWLPTSPFWHFIFKARLLSKHSRNKICLRVEFNINLQLCTACYPKMKAASCPRQDAECCAMGMPALSPGWLCWGSAQSSSHPAALQRPHPAPGHGAGTAGLPCACLLVQAWKGKVLSTPDPFLIDVTGEGKPLYFSLVFLYLSQQSVLKAFSFFWVLLVLQESFLPPSTSFFFSNTDPGNHQELLSFWLSRMQKAWNKQTPNPKEEDLEKLSSGFQSIFYETSLSKDRY